MGKRNANKGLTLDQVCEALRQTHGNISLAGHKLGVTREAIQYYVSTYATAREAMQTAAAAVSDIAEGHLVAAVKRGDLKQVQYWLENKAKDRGWGQKNTPHVSLTYAELMEMSEADLDKLIAQLGKL